MTSDMWRLSIKTWGRTTKILMLRSTPWRWFSHARWRQSVWRMVRGAHVWWKVSLLIVEMVGRIGGTIKVVPGREVILHEPRWDTVEVVGMWWLVKWWVLLVLLEGRLLAEMGGPLHSKWWIPLASPGGLMLVVPGGLILVIPGWLMLIVPWSIPLVVPIWFPLVIPHSFMVVIPGLAVRWALVWSIKTLVKLLLLLLPPERHCRPFKPRWLGRRVFMLPWSSLSHWRGLLPSTWHIVRKGMGRLGLLW